MVPGGAVASSAQTTAVRTSDGEELRHTVVPGPPGTWVVVAHGFGGSRARPSVVRAVRALSATATVLSYDARGHGGSTGRSTVGVREALDVDAAVAHARAQGAERVVTLGFSMGGAAVLRQAALDDVDGHPLTARPDAVVAVSSPAHWRGSSTAARRLRLLVTTPPGRLVCARVLGARVAPRFDAAAPGPVDVVGRVRVPLLLVHGTADGYFGVDHPHALQRAAGPGCTLWLEDGLGHAEDACPEPLLQRLASALPRLSEGARP